MIRFYPVLVKLLKSVGVAQRRTVVLPVNRTLLQCGRNLCERHCRRLGAHILEEINKHRRFRDSHL